jgi:glycosyltransferase involved in cell wall biosynthesis
LFHELGCPDHIPQQRLHYMKLGEVLSLCTQIAALSPALAQGWRAFYSLARPLRVLPLIYDDTPLCGRAPAADGTIRIGYAARLEHGKGVMFLLDAFARVHAARPEVRLVIAGVGPLEGQARARIESPDIAGSCELVGYVSESEKPRFLSSLDIFVLPTLAEGTPNCVLEAMLFGLAVIASDVGGLPDMLADGAGMLVPVRDVDALADAILELTDSVALRLELGRRARQRYERLFRPDVVLEALLHEYRRVVQRRGDSLLAGCSHPWLQDDAPASPPARREDGEQSMRGTSVATT